MLLTFHFVIPIPDYIFDDWVLYRRSYYWYRHYVDMKIEYTVHI